MQEAVKKYQMSDSDYKELLQEDQIIFQFPVLWHEWECDGVAWVMEKPDGTRYLKMTSHGGEYVADYDVLIERLIYYSQVHQETQKAMALLQKTATE